MSICSTRESLYPFEHYLKPTYINHILHKRRKDSQCPVPELEIEHHLVKGDIALEKDILTLQETPVVPTNPTKRNGAAVQNHQQGERKVFRCPIVAVNFIADSWRTKSAFIMPEPSVRLGGLRLAAIIMVHVTNTRATSGHGVCSKSKNLVRCATSLLAD